MKINFKAIVDSHKLPAHLALLPLFEAIINSIQSIAEANIDNGEIHIKVIRDGDMFGGSNWETDVDSFVITDNGIGFNEANFSSFDIYGSDHKIAIGCKGIGRVLWLKAFSKVRVESTYKGNDGKFYDRNFDFTIAEETKIIDEKPSQNTFTCTKVTLDTYAKKYKSKCPKRIDTLARDIMNHCFAYLALKACPTIIISDDDDSRCINTLFEECTKGQLEVTEFEVEGSKFSIISAKNYSAVSTEKHTLHFCAHKREVFGENLSSTIRELTGKLSNDDGDFVYSGYITGDILDENINSERTDFAFSKTSDTDDGLDVNEQLEIEGLASPKSISKKDIIKAAIPFIRDFLKDEILMYNAKKKERIENYVYSANPRYRSLLKHNPECIEKIPLTSDDEKLELELFKQEQIYRLHMKEEQQEFARNDFNHSIDDYFKKYENLSEKISDLGKDGLADYIIHRKVMLDILSKSLEWVGEENQKYALEKIIHKTIFPMNATSDEIDYSKHNLWIIDERLAYHYYLASDKAISNYEIIDSDSNKEPDIAIFEPALALTGENPKSEINNITIIEFKRPGRTDKTCIDQVTEYIKKIRSGKCLDKNGRPLAELTYQNVRFTCYILCDLSRDMEELLQGRDYKKTPDGKSYYQYHDTFNAYIEVLPYGKMVRDATIRNKILFDKLLCQSPNPN